MGKYLAAFVLLGRYLLATEYTVAAGDTLSGIADRYGVSVSELKDMNSLKGDTIRIGDTLIIEVRAEHTVIAGDSLSSIADKYRVSVESIRSINKVEEDRIFIGQTLLISGSDLRFYSTHTVKSGESLDLIARRYGVRVGDIKTLNKIKGDLIHPRDELKIPSGEIEAVSSRSIMYNMHWPVEWLGVTSSYGYRTHPVTGKRNSYHTGVDLRAPIGLPVSSAKDGTVRIAGWLRGYGKTIIVDHADGYSTLYAHLDTIDVRAGQKVKRGGTIGKSGATGTATGPHLHFEVRKNDKTMDPMQFR